MTELIFPCVQDIQLAAKRIDGLAVKTPLLESLPLSEELGARVFLKPESLQRVGAFKFRGAYNRLCQLSEAEKERGVVAFSSGNHAQGVAAAAKMLGIKAVIVMPLDAPKIKKRNTISYGAEVIEYDREKESREEIAAKIATERKLIVVPAFDDFDVICGQGTAALEIIDQGKKRGVSFDHFVCPVGGGGLISGCGTAFKSLSPQTEVHGVEPEDFDDVKRSLAEGSCKKNAQQTGSICDALLPLSPGPMTFGIMQKTVKSILTISDEEALHAVKYSWETLKLVVEPGGAAALAALLAGKLDVSGQNICILLSGGNIDPDIYARAITS